MYNQTELHIGMKCVKYMLFVANFMFVLVGFLLISIGSTIKAVYGDFDQFVAGYYYSPSKLAIAAGILIFFVAIFGCLGAIKESVCLINTYSLFLFFILILEMAAGITSYALRYNIKETLKINMETSMKSYEYCDQYVWNATQYNLECCGIDGPSDWYPYDSNRRYGLVHVRSSSTENSSYTVPLTCCAHETCTDEKSIYKQGCLNTLVYIMSECAFLLGTGALCISLIQVLGVVFAHLLAKSIRGLKTQIEVDRMERRQQIYEQFNINNTEKLTPVLYTPTSSEA